MGRLALASVALVLLEIGTAQAQPEWSRSGVWTTVYEAPGGKRVPATLVFRNGRGKYITAYGSGTLSGIEYRGRQSHPPNPAHPNGDTTAAIVGTWTWDRDRSQSGFFVFRQPDRSGLMNGYWGTRWPKIEGTWDSVVPVAGFNGASAPIQVPQRPEAPPDHWLLKAIDAAEAKEQREVEAIRGLDATIMSQIIGDKTLKREFLLAENKLNYDRIWGSTINSLNQLRDNGLEILAVSERPKPPISGSSSRSVVFQPTVTRKGHIIERSYIGIVMSDPSPPVRDSVRFDIQLITQVKLGASYTWRTISFAEVTATTNGASTSTKTSKVQEAIERALFSK